MKKRKFFYFSFLILSCLISVLIFHDIDTNLTEEDKQVLSPILDTLLVSKPMTYSEEIEQISLIQLKILSLSPPLSGNGEGIPHKQSREPKEFFQADVTVCYDRSRALEKALKYGGYEVRHAAIYSSRKGEPSFKDLLSSSSPSHSTLEVKTSKGWMIVDSNHAWLGLDEESNPRSIESLSKNIPNWKMPYPDKFYMVYYGKPVKCVYGLYSRHGNFYPPYNFIPDYDLGELLFNFFE